MPFQPEPTPYLQFFGPSKSSNSLHAKDVRSGNKIPLFAIETSKHPKPNLNIFRILPNGNRQPFATATWASLSSSITVFLHGQEIKMTTDLASATGSRSFSTHAGKLRWRPKDSGTGYELMDKNRTKLARYKLMKSNGTGEPTLEIFMSGDDFFVDMVVATGIAMMEKEEREGKQVFKFLEHMFM